MRDLVIVDGVDALQVWRQRRFSFVAMSSTTMKPVSLDPDSHELVCEISLIGQLMKAVLLPPRKQLTVMSAGVDLLHCIPLPLSARCSPITSSSTCSLP